MRFTLLIVLITICYSSLGQTNPNFIFEDRTFIYGDGNDKRKIQLEATSSNSQGKITYEIISKNPTSGNQNDYVIDYFREWHIMNAGTTVIKAKIAAWDQYKEASKTATITIEQKEIDATISNEKRVYGEESPSFTPSFTGLAYNETQSNLNPPPTLDSYPKNTDVGSHPVSFQSEPRWNYKVKVSSGNLEISQAKLHIKHKYPDEGQEFYLRKYGSSDPLFGHDWVLDDNEKFVEGDTKAVVTNTLEITTGSEIKDTTDCTGTTPLKLNMSELKSTNYKFIIEPALLHIVKAYIEIQSLDQSLRYGTITDSLDNSKFSCDFPFPKDIVLFDSLPILTTTATDTTKAETTSDITFKYYGKHRNYTLNPSATNGTLTVERAPIEIMPKNVSCTYRHSIDLGDEVVITGFKNEENADIFKLGNALTKTGTTIFSGEAVKISLKDEDIEDTLNVNSYSTLVENVFQNTDNYTVSTHYGKLTINKAELKINNQDINIFVEDTVPDFKKQDISWDHSGDLDEPLPSLLSIGNLQIDDTYTGHTSGEFPITYPNLNPSNFNNYNFVFDTCLLTVYDTASINNQTLVAEPCRDTSTTFSVSSSSWSGVEKTYQWYFQSPKDTFQVITPAIPNSDSVKLSAFNTEKLKMDSVLMDHEKYQFKCKVTHTIQVYPEDDSSTLSKESSIFSEPAKLEIKDTPLFADIKVKGESILICMDNTPNTSYSWYFEGEENTILGTDRYLDIAYNNPSDSLLFRIKTTNNESNCSTISSLLTKDGFIGDFDQNPNPFTISLYPNPIDEDGWIEIHASSFIVNEPYLIRLVNLQGQLMKHIEGIVPPGKTEKLNLNIPSGMYILEVMQADMRDSKIIFVNEAQR